AARVCGLCAAELGAGRVHRYGRFDFLYDGAGPPKLLEFNADTPTGLLEAAVIQWFWLEEVAPEADQLHTIHEHFLEIWRTLEEPTKWLEAPWKMLLSSKALFPLLYEMFPDHPNLLPASWQPVSGYQVRKPLRGREGANITLLDGDQVKLTTEGAYGAGPFIY